MPLIRTPDDLYPFWSCMNKWLFQPSISTQSYTHLVAQLGGVQAEIESHVAGAAEPVFLAASLPDLGRRRRWSGAVVQDNCETYARTQFNSTQTSEPRVRT